MIDPKEMRNIAAERGKTYAFLAALYLAPPSPEVAAAIRADGIGSDGGTALRAAAEALAAGFREAVEKGLSEADIVAEYTRLFVLPSGVVPHESCYTDENKRVGGHVTVAVRQFYQAAAAEVLAGCLELPDHMGVELEFMKFLCDLEEQFWREENEEGLRLCLGFQNNFLTGHLLCWHEALCTQLANAATLDLYRALACLTREFINAERDYVTELTKEICSEGRTACVSES